MSPHTGVRVRRATQADAPALARLRLALRTERAPVVETEDAFIGRCTAWMHWRLGEASPWRVWVLDAATSTRLVGNLWLQVVEKIPNPAAEAEVHAYVSNFFVDQDYRDGGWGSSLLSTALDECARLQVDTVFLWPTARSRPLYERHGFTSADGMLVRER